MDKEEGVGFATTPKKSRINSPGCLTGTKAELDIHFSNASEMYERTIPESSTNIEDDNGAFNTSTPLEPNTEKKNHFSFEPTSESAEIRSPSDSTKLMDNDQDVPTANDTTQHSAEESVTQSSKEVCKNLVQSSKTEAPLTLVESPNTDAKDKLLDSDLGTSVDQTSHDVYGNGGLSHGVLFTEAASLGRIDFQDKDPMIASYAHNIASISKSIEVSATGIEHNIDSETTLQDQVASGTTVTISRRDESIECTSSRNDENVKKGRRKISNFKKSCMDFFLDDDSNKDFSAGSSDEWENEEELSDSSVETEKKRGKRKIKDVSNHGNGNELVPQKPKANKNKRKIRKGLKERGLSHETISGKLKPARKLQSNPCKEQKCPRKCYEISDERRQRIFDYFWSMTDERKRDWIVQCSKPITIKRKKTKSTESRRSLTYEYFINEDEGRRQVCQQFIIKTLDISQTYLLYNINNAEEGMSRLDRRKRTAADKYDEQTKLFAKSYIETLPALPSHYSRKKSDKLYLPIEFRNTSNLYRLYIKHCNKKSESPLSEKIFTNLFKEYNFSFHVPKKDKCSLCTKFENNPDKNTEEEMRVHNTEKEATYKRFQIHQNIKSDNATVTASFDLQKVLGTPHGESMMLYYSRKYAVFNFTVYESRTQNGYCYTWGESDGKRGSCDIATCLFLYLKEVDERGVEKLILYCDNCAGQNKNKVVLSLFKYFLERSKSLLVIQVNYLLPGHTYMPVDSMHAIIEREIKKLIVWGPSQWACFMESARKRPHPYSVNVLEYKDFIDFNVIAEKTFTTSTVKNKDLRLKDIRVCTFRKNDLKKMDVKYTMSENGTTYEIPLCKEMKNKVKGQSTGKRVIRSKGKDKSLRKMSQVAPESCNVSPTESIMDSLPTLYKERLPIATAKFNDLKKLCDNGIIPKRFHNEYFNLPHKSKVQDVLNETDVEDIDDTPD